MKFLVSSAILDEDVVLDFTRLNTSDIRLSKERLLESSSFSEVLRGGSGVGSDFELSDNNLS